MLLFTLFVIVSTTWTESVSAFHASSTLSMTREGAAHNDRLPWKRSWSSATTSIPSRSHRIGRGSKRRSLALFSSAEPRRGREIGDSRTRGAAAAAAAATAAKEARRRTLLSRKGPFFQLDRFAGKIEFGATANLVTRLQNADTTAIAAWLQDERGLAMSIWDEKLIQEKGNSVYRLQIMTLQFVTLQLAPWVDVEMKTITTGSTTTDQSSPVFRVQSLNFDPNIQVFPGMRVSAESLGIVIDVSGELRPSPDGKGVTGSIAFSTVGILPPPLRILPESALKAASDSINQTLVNFAIRSFEKGAREQYLRFLQRQKQQQQQQQAKNAQ